jgi:amino acid adenylation domain-containing protein
VGPRNDGERLVAEAMERVLGQQGLNVDDDFFSLGGHSLLAARLATSLSRTSGQKLPMRAVFDAPTIERLAASMARDDGGAGRAIEPIAARALQDEAPASLMQQRVWFLEQMEPGRPTYNVPLTLRLSGALNVDALERAFNTIIARQAVLRTEIVDPDGTPMQRVRPELRVSLSPIEDLSALPADARNEALTAALQARAAELIDLHRAPLFKLGLYRLSDEEHVLFFMPHHLIWDGASIDLFHEEMAALYGAYGQGLEPEQAALAVSYGDFAQWQQAWLRSDDLQQQLAHLKALMADLPEPVELPLDRPRPARMSGEGANERVSFAHDLVEDARRIGQAANATLFMTLLAAYAAMLSRVTGQTDFIIGTPVRGKHSADVEKLMGFFVNALPLRIKVTPDRPFAELLQHVRTVVLDAFSHPDAPFEQLVRELKLPRDESRSPIYQTVFSFQDARQRIATWGSLTVEDRPIASPSSQVDLGLWFVEDSEGVSGDIQYNTDVFNADSARRVRRWFELMLRAAIAAPQLPVSRMELVPDEERQALSTWNRTRLDFARDRTVNAIIEACAARDPHRPALRSGAEIVTYGELDARANRLAHLLRARGMGRGALVGLCVERSADMVVAQLAILKSGAAYVPLDPAYPAQRLTYMAQDAKLALMVSHSSMSDIVSWPRDATVLMDTDAALLAAQPDALPARDSARDARAEDPAYAIYTSGSTGKPKGVVVPHRAVVNFLGSMAREPGLAASDRLLAVTTLSFDIAVLELLLPLSVGAQVLLASREDAMSGSALRALLEGSGVTVMQATPGTWHMLIDAGWQGSPAFKALVGGESLPAELAHQLLKRSGQLWNMYGPTETTVWSTCCRVENPDLGISIGRPIANTQVHILDARGQTCPIGVAGEIVIGGDGVALGYLDRPELSAERFIADPFEPAGQRRLYRTGDRGRWRGDGMLEHMGRLDSQVKVRGHRIELGEIETNLLTHPQIAQGVVIVREDSPGDQRLVSYVVPRGTAPSTAELREYLRDVLPQYMLPQHVVPIDAIPRLPNGKIDRRGLPHPGATPMDRVVTAERPLTAVETAIAGIWEELLGIEGVQVTDNFFDLGGHSLLAMRAVANIERRLGVRIDVRRLIFESLGQLAAGTGEPVADGGRPLAPKKGMLDRLMDSLRARTRAE